MIEYSFIVPIYNDGYLVHEFCLAFEDTFKTFLNTDDISSNVELIFVNDGSSDQSLNSILKSAEIFKFVKVIDLSRNFGHHIALSCGYQHAIGKYIGMLNVDMQDPPSQIPLLLECICKGEHDIVYGLREARNSSWFEKITSMAFIYVLNKLTNDHVPYRIATLRIMSRRFIDAYNQLTEKSRFIPGLETWLGFSHCYVGILHQRRKDDRSSYTFWSRLRMAIESVISFSDLPLRIISVFGMLIAFLGFMVITALIFAKFFYNNMPVGYASIIAVFIFFGGIQILVIGLTGLYIGRILKEVQNRPLYVIKNKYNFDHF